MSKIEIVRAGQEDSADILAWRNDPLTRQMARNEKEVSQSEHEKWFASILGNPLVFLYIAKDSETHEKLAVCRFDKVESGLAAEVSINLNPDARGKGLSSPILKRAIEQLVEDTHPSLVFGHIKELNIASVRCLLKIGFTIVENDQGLLRLELEV